MTNFVEHSFHDPMMDSFTDLPDIEKPSQILRAQEFIRSFGGIINPETKPYKSFDPEKHERFLVEKGELNGAPVVFKIGEEENESAIQNESRNLQVIKNASAAPEKPPDVHMVQQVGSLFENGGMVGLATEFLQDNVELKRSLTPEQKVEIIGRTIENLQRLPVTDGARERGVPVIDGETIGRDAQHFLDILFREGKIDTDTTERLKQVFREAQLSLAAEQSVFVHGDAHGDNIFLQEAETGEIDISLLDFEGLRISNQYYDWSEILNKSVLFEHLQRSHPEIYGPIKNNAENMWLDKSVTFDEQQIVERITGGDPDRTRNFRLTRIYDMLSRIVGDRDSTDSIAQEREKVYTELLKESVI